MRLNPFDLAGPEFLLFYAGLAAVLAAIVWITRFAVATGVDSGPPDPTLDPYELAFLAGGRSRVVLLAVASLVDRGLVRLSGRLLTYRERPAAGALHPIERELLSREPGSVDAARRSIGQLTDAMEATLQAEGLTASHEATMLSRTVALAAVVVAGVVGAIKVSVGVSRDRPVGFLVIMMAVALVALGAAFALPARRTARGARILRSLRSGGSGDPRYRRPKLTEPSGATAVAVWGLPALAAHPAYEDLSRGFAGSSGDGGSSGSGCSSSSCGGGGGGCGGCSS